MLATLLLAAFTVPANQTATFTHGAQLGHEDPMVNGEHVTYRLEAVEIHYDYYDPSSPPVVIDLTNEVNSSHSCHGYMPPLPPSDTPAIAPRLGFGLHLIGIGSGWFIWNPDTTTAVWQRTEWVNGQPFPRNYYYTNEAWGGWFTGHPAGYECDCCSTW